MARRSTCVRHRIRAFAYFDRRMEESVCHSFGSGQDGRKPATTLVMDASGILYGEASFGGIDNTGLARNTASTDAETVFRNHAVGSRRRWIQDKKGSVREDRCPCDWRLVNALAAQMARKAKIPTAKARPIPSASSLARKAGRSFRKQEVSIRSASMPEQE